MGTDKLFFIWKEGEQSVCEENLCFRENIQRFLTKGPRIESRLI